MKKYTYLSMVSLLLLTSSFLEAGKRKAEEELEGQPVFKQQKRQLPSPFESLPPEIIEYICSYYSGDGDNYMYVFGGANKTIKNIIDKIWQGRAQYMHITPEQSKAIIKEGYNPNKMAYLILLKMATEIGKQPNRDDHEKCLKRSEQVKTYLTDDYTPCISRFFTGIHRDYDYYDMASRLDFSANNSPYTKDKFSTSYELSSPTFFFNGFQGDMGKDIENFDKRRLLKPGQHHIILQMADDPSLLTNMKEDQIDTLFKENEHNIVIKKALYKTYLINFEYRVWFSRILINYYINDDYIDTLLCDHAIAFDFRETKLIDDSLKNRNKRLIEKLEEIKALEKFYNFYMYQWCMDLYIEGPGKDCLHKAAEMGLAQAEYEYGCLEGVSKDEKIKYLKRAADKNHGGAMVELSKLIKENEKIDWALQALNYYDQDIRKFVSLFESKNLETQFLQKIVDKKWENFSDHFKYLLAKDENNK